MGSSQPPPFGVYSPVVCFFNDDESIDFQSISSHVKRLIASGVRGLVIHGSNGEAVHLEEDEKLQVLHYVRSIVREQGANITIISGCSASSVRGTSSRIAAANQAGADYALVLPPSYWSAAMSKLVIKTFYDEVARDSALPIIIYNFPGVASGIDIDSDLIIDLANISPNIIGVKLTCGNLGKLQRISATLPTSRFAAFAGKADFMLPGLLAGSNGVISALANVVPAVHVELARLIHQRRFDEAKAIQGDLSKADAALLKFGIPGVKAACSHWFGYGTGKARLPLPTVEIDDFASGIGTSLERLVQKEKHLTGVSNPVDKHTSSKL